MSDKPRRAWFQLHLSTAILLMFVAGGLVWANIGTLNAETIDFDIHGGDPLDWIPIKKTMRSFGWPLLFYGAPEMHVSMARVYCFTGTSILAAPMIFDILFACTLIIVTAFLSGWRIRRREARKT